MKELLTKLAAFQQECPVILKDTKAKNYNYADLPAILAVINPLLNKHRLMFTQPLEYDQGKRFIRTIIYDLESGETLESRVDIPEVSFNYVNDKGDTIGLMNDYQALGSGITYMRRYALSSVLGIVTDKDTDAQGEQVKPKATKKEDNELPWMTEKQFYSASQRIKEANPYVTINDGDDQLSLTPVEFVEKLTKTYRMKKSYLDALNTDVEFQTTLMKPQMTPDLSET